MTPEQLRECPIDQCAENTDREIYRGPEDGRGDYYSDSLHVTKEGALGINCGGYVIVKPIRTWHGMAKAHAAALEEIERLREAVELLYDRWENGEDCHEVSGDEMGAFLGKAFQLSREEEDAILALLKGIPSPAPMQVLAQRAEQAERRAERLKGHAEALLEQLRTMRIHFVSTLESARERIIWNGGECDSVEKMEADDPYLKSSWKVMEAYRAAHQDVDVVAEQ